VSAAPTATEALLRAGYTHRPVGVIGMHEIVRMADGTVVAVLRAREVWAWLAERAEDREQTQQGRRCDEFS